MLFDILIIWWIVKTIPKCIDEINQSDPYYEYYTILINKIIISIGIITIGLCTHSLTISIQKIISWI